MFDNLEGFEVFGVNTGDLHYKKSVICNVEELAEKAGESKDKCSYCYEDDMLNNEIKGEADFYEVCANDTLFGIAPIYPFDKMYGLEHNWRTFKDTNEAAKYIGNLLEPLVKESAEEIAKKCDYIHCIREC